MADSNQDREKLETDCSYNGGHTVPETAASSLIPNGASRDPVMSEPDQVGCNGVSVTQPRDTELVYAQRSSRVELIKTTIKDKAKKVEDAAERNPRITKSICVIPICFKVVFILILLIVGGVLVVWTVMYVDYKVKYHYRESCDNWQCPIYSRNWPDDNHTYNIPRNDFNRMCPTCDSRVPPIVTFYRGIPVEDGPYNISTVCIVDMRQNSTTDDNENCMSSVRQLLHDPLFKLVYMIHGFGSSSEKRWVTGMRDGIINRFKKGGNDVVVGVVGWGYSWGSSSHSRRKRSTTLRGTYEQLFRLGTKTVLTDFPHSAPNTMVIGHLVGLLTQKVTADQTSNVFCYGHSLGAHICGYAGKTFGRFKGIVAMDPAGPPYNSHLHSDFNKLGKHDADVVQVVHTSRALGYKTSLGDIDIYLNGGFDQPGCGISLCDLKCSHRFPSKLLIYYYNNWPNVTCNAMVEYDNQNSKFPGNMSVEIGDLDSFDEYSSNIKAGSMSGDIDTKTNKSSCFFTLYPRHHFYKVFKSWMKGC